MNVPIKHINSLTKPLSPGKPTLDRTKKTINTDHTGIFFASPPITFMSLVWYRSYIIPMRKKSAPVERPWFSI